MAMDSDRANGTAGDGLLMAHDPAPVTTINPGGGSPFLLLGDHAGNAVPARLDRLGLPNRELSRHIGWDIGIADLGPMLAAELDAVFIRQTYSRLVIDCNRDPARADAMPEVSDLTIVPGNAALSDADRAARIAAIHTPYQTAIAGEIARRGAKGMATILVSLHSFTPAMQGVARPWHVGILYYGGDTGFAKRLLATLQDEAALCVGDNEPYSMELIDHTIPRHAYAAQLLYAEIEVRQDLIDTPDKCVAWSARLAGALRAAV
jgi:predicted N-formylglutamate amidohydrolase